MSAIGDRRDAGFTLLEALVVVALTAMIAGLLFPNVSRALTAVEARQSANLVAAELRLARAQAVRTDRDVSLTISADGRRYGRGQPDRALPSAVRIVARPARIRFSADGSSSGGVLAVGSAFRVVVEPATGAVAVGRS